MTPQMTDLQAEMSNGAMFMPNSPGHSARPGMLAEETGSFGRGNSRGWVDGPEGISVAREHTRSYPPFCNPIFLLLRHTVVK